MALKVGSSRASAGSGDSPDSGPAVYEGGDCDGLGGGGFGCVEGVGGSLSALEAYLGPTCLRPTVHPSDEWGV